MNKIWLIIRREFITRVKKRSFLLATILTPLLFPLIIGGIIYLSVRDDANREVRTIEVYDPEGVLSLESDNRFEFVNIVGDSAQRVEAFKTGDHYGMLEIGMGYEGDYRIYTKSSISLTDNERIEGMIEASIRQKRLDSLKIDQATLNALRPRVSLKTYNIEDQTQTSSAIAFAIGYAGGFLIYMFLFIYGAQVMQGVIEEKSSKIVEVLVSTVRPFQLMLGKVVGIASVGLIQLLIWVVLISVFSSVIFVLYGVDIGSAGNMNQMAQSQNVDAAQEIANTFYSIPFFSIVSVFIFYFLGGYLLYGALFAAIGSAVDSPSEAQQFMFPVTIPLIASIIGLSAVLQNPDGSLAFWLSIIPFTAPVSMMGRIGFGTPPLWELGLSMTMLTLGFIGTIWLAGRIYRIGILMHGTKVNYKVLARWFMMKN